MAALNPQAVDLNNTIKKINSTVYELLSKKGKAIYFPNKGILAQGAAAKDKEINATIGTAYEDDGKPMVLPSVASRLLLEAKDAFPYAPSDGVKSLREKWLEGYQCPGGELRGDQRSKHCRLPFCRRNR
jgi:aspartate/tyrosine/aromatic aminotransferase